MLVSALEHKRAVSTIQSCCPCSGSLDQTGVGLSLPGVLCLCGLDFQLMLVALLLWVMLATMERGLTALLLEESLSLLEVASWSGSGDASSACARSKGNSRVVRSTTQAFYERKSLYISLYCPCRLTTRLELWLVESWFADIAPRRKRSRDDTTPGHELESMTFV